MCGCGAYQGKVGRVVSSVLSPEPSHSEDLHDLSRATLITLCLVGFLTGWAWLFVAATLAPDLSKQIAEARTLVPPALLLAMCTACLLRTRLALAWRSALLLVSMGGALLLSYLWLPDLGWLYYLSLVVIVAGLLVGASASWATSFVLTLTLFALSHMDAEPHSLTAFLPPLGLLWAAALVSWLSSRSLYTALRWALSSQQRASALLTELRQRQGELNRTLEALTEASRRLERTNRELAIARERAEEARAMKEHFVANVSHELRTPLNLIVGFSELMYLEPESYRGVGWTPDLQADIGELYRASRHLQSLVNDILDLSRIDASRLPMFRELADVRTVIGEAVETMAPLLRQRKLHQTVEWPEALAPTFIDQTRIRQVMLNLLNNAVRFTDSGGITVHVEQTSEAVVVSVRDTGGGIPRDKLESIFKEFQQVDDGPRRRGGAGLGLALSRQFVELHGGRMWAVSEVGTGSTFYFSLPLPGATPQTAPLLHIPDRKRTDLANSPLIVVDPDPTIAGMLSRYLGDRPLLPARDALEAEALIESEHPLGVIVNQPPDSSADAWTGVLGAASRRYNVPVFRCSIPSPSWLKQATGLNDCLTKPVSREVLGALLEQYAKRCGTILVIDDDPGFASLMVRMLGTLPSAGKVSIAYSGADGLRLAHEVAPQLILLDLLLPDMHGLAVLDAIRGDPLLAKTRVVVVTATSYAEEALLHRGGLFTLTQASGISTGTFADLLNVACQYVRPNYVEART